MLQTMNYGDTTQDENEPRMFKISFGMDFAQGVEEVVVFKQHSSVSGIRDVINNALEARNTQAAFECDRTGVVRFVHSMKVGTITVTEVDE